MLRIVVLLAIACCYSSAELLKLTIATIPDSVPETKVNATEAGGRIIGGTPAPIERYPFAVQVLYQNQLSCGGTLLTARHVLSAAHCFVDGRNALLSASLFSCRVGSATLNTGGTVARLSRIINHERYNLGAARDNDISVLVLATTLTLSQTVFPATIPMQGGVVPDNALVWAAGWGRTIADVNQASPVLNEVWVYTINTAVCAQRYRYLELENNTPYPITYNMMCTGLLDIGGQDACYGDSGGPVVYAGLVVGVTSWGQGCASPFYPGVNARVAAYTNWINSTVIRYNGAPSLGQASFLLLLTSCLATMFSNKL